MTLEQILKRALTIGTHVCELHKRGIQRRVIVTIGKRGRVMLLPMPTADEMYTSAARVRGDSLEWGQGQIVVWAARSPEFMAQFEGEAIAICCD